jgi:hypothetical protein
LVVSRTRNIRSDAGNRSQAVTVRSPPGHVDLVVSADDAGHGAAESELAAIRQSLRLGTIATRQITRNSVVNRTT